MTKIKNLDRLYVNSNIMLTVFIWTCAVSIIVLIYSLFTMNEFIWVVSCIGIAFSILMIYVTGIIFDLCHDLRKVIRETEYYKTRWFEFQNSISPRMNIEDSNNLITYTPYSTELLEKVLISITKKR